MFGEASFPVTRFPVLADFPDSKERMVKGQSFLSEWVNVTNSFQATDSWDNIYGILGMTSRNFRMIEPDYKTVVEVYCGVTAHVISSSGLSCLQVDRDNKRLEHRLTS